MRSEQFKEKYLFLIIIVVFEIILHVSFIKYLCISFPHIYLLITLYESNVYAILRKIPLYKEKNEVKLASFLEAVSFTVVSKQAMFLFELPRNGYYSNNLCFLFLQD